ncbi:Tricalbin-2 [Malassezia pachydermatis]|uniref:Tcb3-protein localized to bud-enriched n=1 Tax=Malassezia pachydermatis TaxID=77020 RepID=A0A0N0RS74_9BASI|nr:tcb3-protein localized to bud-enriched [Malassezia pachydermatis]KOS14145.1 tcb3-protein localized to bud-enriched [Malassezia pachydermatis]
MVSLHNPFSKGDKENEPPSDPKQVQKDFAHELEAEGADVNVFDENASPEQKARAAAKARQDIQPRGEMAELQEEKKRKEIEILNRECSSDLQGRRVRADVGIRDIDEASRQRGQLGGELLVPGALPAGSPSVNIPDWYTVGWIGVSRRMLGMKPDELDVQRAQLRDTDIVSSFLEDAYYGYLWFDAGAIVGAVIVTYLMTRFGAGWGMAIIIMAVAGTYYTTSVRRTRQRVRDDVARELARHRMISENETARWINHFLARFWLIYEPVLSATIIQSVDEVLRDNTPAFLDSLRLTTFTLGTKAPIVEYVRTLSDTDDDIIVMDWKVSFTPSDVADLTVRQASRRINPKVVLTIRVGKGMVGAGLPILVENMSFVGTMRIRLKLISSFPHVQMVDLSFMEPPSFDFELKPIGGSTFGLDVAALPGLSGFIQNQVHASLGPMMYNPNQFSLNLEDIMSGTPLDATVGVLQVTIWSARDLRRVSVMGGEPDPYVSISLNDGKEIARTGAKTAISQPTFKETKHVLLKELQGLLSLTVMDDNGSRPDTRLGVTRFDLSSLMQNPNPGQLNKAIMYDEKPSGSVQYSLSYFPVLKPESAPDGTLLPLPETSAGIMRLTLHQVRDLVPSKTLEGFMHPKARLSLNKKLIKETAVIKDTHDPIFEEVLEFFITDRYGSTLTVDIVDARPLAKDAVVASLNVRVDDIVHARQRKQDWFPFPNNDRARLRMSGQWKPILMSGSINGSNSYRPAIGVLKFWVRRAKDLKNVEALSGGKSDPYAMLRVNNLVVSGTSVIDDNLNPVWNQVLYAPVHSTAEVVRLEVMDYQTSTADRTLGYCDLPVSKLASDNVSDSTYPYQGLGRQAHHEPLRQPNGTTKGTIDFDVEFLPSMHVRGANFLEQNRRLEAERRKAEGRAAPAAQNSLFDSPDAIEAAGGATRAGHATTYDDDMEDDDPDAGMDFTNEQLLSCPSGIVVFNMISGKIARPRAQLEVVFDDAYWPAYTTERRKAEYDWDEVGEAVVRELDVSNVWFRLRTGPRDSDVFAECSMPTKQLLDGTLDEPMELTLSATGENGSMDPSQLLNKPGKLQLDDMKMHAPSMSDITAMPGKAVEKGQSVATKGMEMTSQLGQGEIFAADGTSKIKISCRYIPMDVHLEPVESVVNQGLLSIEVLSCANLSVADRGGKSDPYVLFQDNGVTVARTKTVKRNLNPTYNEQLPDVFIQSRLTHEYVFNVRDWDQVGASDPLGKAVVNLAELEPFETYERTYPLTGEGANDDSSITVRLMFQPQYLNNRTHKLNRHLVGDVASNVIGGIGGLGRGVATGGKTFGRGIMGVVGLGKKGKDEEDAEAAAMEYAAMHQPPEAAGSMSPGPAGGEAHPHHHDVMSMHSRQGGGDAGSMQETVSLMEGGQHARRRHRLHNPFKKRT